MYVRVLRPGGARTLRGVVARRRSFRRPRVRPVQHRLQFHSRFVIVAAFIIHDTLHVDYALNRQSPLPPPLGTSFNTNYSKRTFASIRNRFSRKRITKTLNFVIITQSPRPPSRYRLLVSSFHYIRTRLHTSDTSRVPVSSVPSSAVANRHRINLTRRRYRYFEVGDQA